MSKESDVQAGVRDAWDFWLSQHPISVPELIFDATKEAVANWMSVHGEGLFERAITEWLDKNGAEIFKRPDDGKSKT